MGSELAAAILALTAGTAMFGGVVIHETRRDRIMRDQRRPYRLTFPAGTQPSATLAALSAMSGLDPRFEIVCEVIATGDGIEHILHLPEEAAAAVIDILTSSLPSIRCETIDIQPTDDWMIARRIIVPPDALLRDTDPVMASRALVAGMAALGPDERVSLRWTLRPGRTAPIIAPKAQPSEQDRIQARAHCARHGQPGFTVSGLLLAHADSRERSRLLARHVVGVLRSRRGVGRGLVVRGLRPWDAPTRPDRRFARGWLPVGELLPLLGWPLGDDLIPGVQVGAARRLAVPRGVPSTGRRLFVGRDARGERPVGLSTAAAVHHLAVVGGSGTGKSTLLARGVLDCLAAGFGGILIDPKADLVQTISDRVPARDVDRVVVLDPAASGPVPGIDLFVGDADLRTDVLLGSLSQVFKDSWGVRTDLYLRLGLRTLSAQPRPVLTDWIRLFTDTGFRQSAVGRLSDPLLLAAWRSYEALSPAEAHQHLAAPMSKMISLLGRPAVRNVLAQPSPRLEVDHLLRERKWLLVSLAPGTLGEATAHLLGSILTYAAWTAIEARTALPESQRRPVFLVFDELQSLSTLPWSLEHLFERARGLGCGVTVATQVLGRLPESVRSSLLGNVGSLITFRAGFDEATRLARELPGLGAADLQALRPFEIAARISTGVGSGTAVMTGHTEPLPPVTGQADRIRKRSAERYGGLAATTNLAAAATTDGPPGAGFGRSRRGA